MKERPMTTTMPPTAESLWRILGRREREVTRLRGDLVAIHAERRVLRRQLARAMAMGRQIFRASPQHQQAHARYWQSDSGRHCWLAGWTPTAAEVLAARHRWRGSCRRLLDRILRASGDLTPEHLTHRGAEARAALRRGMDQDDRDAWEHRAYLGDPPRDRRGYICYLRGPVVVAALRAGQAQEEVDRAKLERAEEALDRTALKKVARLTPDDQQRLGLDLAWATAGAQLRVSRRTTDAREADRLLRQVRPLLTLSERRLLTDRMIGPAEGDPQAEEWPRLPWTDPAVSPETATEEVERWR